MSLFKKCKPQPELNWAEITQRIYKEHAEHERLVLEHFQYLLGRRAIHMQSNEAGIINHIAWDRYADVVVYINNSRQIGHRHYFYIEGADDMSGVIFEEKKHEHFMG